MKTLALFLFVAGLAYANPFTAGNDAQVGAWVESSIPVTMLQGAQLSATPVGTVSYFTGAHLAQLDYAFEDGANLHGDFTGFVRGDGNASVAVYLPFTITEQQPYSYASTAQGLFSGRLSGEFTANAGDYSFSGILGPGRYIFSVNASVANGTMDGTFNFHIGEEVVLARQALSVPEGSVIWVMSGVLLLMVWVRASRH